MNVLEVVLVKATGLGAANTSELASLKAGANMVESAEAKVGLSGIANMDESGVANIVGDLEVALANMEGDLGAAGVAKIASSQEVLKLTGSGAT